MADLNFEDDRINFTPLILYIDYIHLLQDDYYKRNYPTITPRDVTYLMNIFYHQNCSQKDLADLLFVSEANVAQIIKRLEKNQYITRTPDLNNKKPFTDVANIEEILETTMTEKYHIQVGDDCRNCLICSRVCPRGNITYVDEKPQIGDNCDFCLCCVHHCKTHTLTIYDELNSNERYRNPNFKISQLIKSNNIN